MKRAVFFLFPVLALLSCSRTTENTGLVTVRIDNGWEFRQADSGQWLPASVPGTIHTDLLANRVISDPYYRVNERDLQWIDKTAWEYQTVFVLNRQMLGKENLELVFDGLDTYADVFLNDQQVLSCDNMFRTWRVECKDNLSRGENILRILFRSPIEEGLKLLEANGYHLPADNDQSIAGEVGDKKISPFIPKAPYHFGWDWGPRLVSSGIWRPVRLEAWDDARFEHMDVNIGHPGNPEHLIAQLDIIAGKESRQEVSLLIDGVLSVSKTVDLQPGSNAVAIPVVIDNPVLWWPRGMGDQKLYRFEAMMSTGEKRTDQIEITSGLRTIRLIQDQDPDGRGKGFYFEVNGKPVFAKGANYIPNDVFLPRVTPDKYEFIVKSAADANMNMLRVWGGGIYENDLFYDLCDQYGILVWQDFMFACAMYPGDDALLDNARIEAVENVKRLRHHPCLALWCGNNEIEVAWAEWEETRGWGWKQRYNEKQRTEIWKAYDTLFHKILPSVVSAYDPEIPYWHSSPSAGFLQLASYETRSGDMHYWGVWHGLHPFSDFRKYRARFMSEYGFQSFPELNSVKKYTLAEDHTIESEVMMAHQRSGIGNLRILQYMAPDYVIPDDFEQFLYVGQLLQAEAIKMAIESHRSDMPYCMGTLYWQLNDCWPVASWSGIDYYGRWKALHYFVKKAYEPVILTVTETGDLLACRIISDRAETQTGNLYMQLLDFNGKEIWHEEASIMIKPQFPTVAFKGSVSEMLNNADRGSVVLVVRLVSADTLVDRCLHYFVQPRDLELIDPGLASQVEEGGDEFMVTLTSVSLAKNVFLSVDGFNGQFSDNFFDVLPREEVMVTCPKAGTLQEFRDRLKVMHMQQSF